MTREEILTMEPGRELDDLIAEKVMYWYSEGQHWITEKMVIRTWEETSFKGFQPSTDISAAWEVVEKFPIVNISRVEVFEKFPHHAVEIFADMETNESSRFEAPTAPEAICKAALLAVTEGKSEGE